MKLYADAIREYEKALSSRDDHPGLRMELGEVFAATSQWSKAEEQFRAEAASSRETPNSPIVLATFCFSKAR